MNTFTNRQWRPLEPAGFDHFSIGEEQSSSVVVALAWSPPGLSKYQRSVLAILTSNLLLSFWARTSDSKINSGWQRVLVVNNAIKKSWSRRSYVPQEFDETLLRRKLRIRNMTWAPHARRPSVNVNHFEARWGTFLLAIANDDDEVLILLISSPFMNSSNSWDSKIVKLISFDEEGPLIDGDVQSDALIKGSTSIELSSGQVTNGSTAARPFGGSRGAAVRPQSLFKSAIESKRFVDSIAWGYWDCRADKVETILTFLHNGIVFHCIFDVFFLFPEYTVLSSVPRFHVKQSFKCKRKENNPSCCRAVWYHLVRNIVSPLSICW